MLTGSSGAARRWDRDDPRYDRAAGAWVGAAAAACIVGAPAAMAAEIAHPDGHGTGPSRLAWLITAALEDMDAAGPAAGAVPTGPDGAWVLALRRTVAQGAVPPVDAKVPAHHPVGAAWQAVVEAPAPPLEPTRSLFPCAQLVEAVWRASAAGGDEAAMYAGALTGARWGVSGVPLEAQRHLADIVAPRSLVARGVVLARGSDPQEWPESSGPHTGQSRFIRTAFHTAHPYDPGVVLGNVSYLRSCEGIDAVVTLNRIGPQECPSHLPARDRVEVWLADEEGVNPNLHFVLDEAAGAVAALRAEGKRVLLHCAAGQSRTPAVAARYAALACGADVVEALRTSIVAVGGHLDTPELARAVAALSGVELADPAAQLFPGGMPPLRAVPKA